ncbi:MAG: amidase, partial [Acidobacteria bacterium]
MRADEQSPPPTRFNEATVADLQAQPAAGRLTSVDLTKFYLTRIKQLDEDGPGLNSIIELNPDALALA